MNHNLRIIISLTIGFLVVNLYSRISSSPFITQIQAENIKGILSNIKFPTISLNKIFTLKINPQIDNHPVSDNQNSFNLTPIPTKPTNLSYVQPSTMPTIDLSPTSNPGSGLFNIPTPTYIAPKIPTYTPRPTKPPKPTSTPKLPPIISDQRPGETLAEIYEEVQKRVCVPAALLYAFQQAETGAWWPVNTSSSKVKIYNKYGWWLDGSGNPCTGMGYHTQTGIVPEDSVNAGVSCQNPISSGPDQAIMGLWQISRYEEDAAKKYTTKIIKGNIDRRVIFDSAVIFAIITKNRLGTPPSNCNDWPADAIKTAAEKHYGACTENYCNKVLNYYKQYK